MDQTVWQDALMNLGSERVRALLEQAGESTLLQPLLEKELGARLLTRLVEIAQTKQAYIDAVKADDKNLTEDMLVARELLSPAREVIAPAPIKEEVPDATVRH